LPTGKLAVTREPFLMTKFVLFATQRSGSTWVVDMLNSSNDILAYSELFLHDGKGVPTWGAKDMIFWSHFVAGQRVNSDAMSDEDLLGRYLDRVFEPRPGITAVGFKLMYGQESAALWKYARDHDVMVVHLIRSNLLDVVLSVRAAETRDLYHASATEHVGEIAITLSPTELPTELHRREMELERAKAKLTAARVRHYEALYEDLVTDSKRFDQLLTVLGARPGGASLTSSLQKLLSLDHKRLIRNFDEIEASLKGTRYHRLLRTDA
jgi:LPS sulfotransferase NodH